MTNQFTKVDDDLQAAVGGHRVLPRGIPGRIRRTDAAVALTEPDNQLRDDGPVGSWWPA